MQKSITKKKPFNFTARPCYEPGKNRKSSVARIPVAASCNYGDDRIWSKKAGPVLAGFL
jgi:hypothetical protein